MRVKNYQWDKDHKRCIDLDESTRTSLNSGNRIFSSTLSSDYFLNKIGIQDKELSKTISSKSYTNINQVGTANRFETFVTKVSETNKQIRDIISRKMRLGYSFDTNYSSYNEILTILKSQEKEILALKQKDLYGTDYSLNSASTSKNIAELQEKIAEANRNIRKYKEKSVEYKRKFNQQMTLNNQLLEENQRFKRVLNITNGSGYLSPKFFSLNSKIYPSSSKKGYSTTTSKHFGLKQDSIILQSPHERKREIKDSIYEYTPRRHYQLNERQISRLGAAIKNTCDTSKLDQNTSSRTKINQTENQKRKWSDTIENYMKTPHQNTKPDETLSEDGGIAKLLISDNKLGKSTPKRSFGSEMDLISSNTDEMMYQDDDSSFVDDDSDSEEKMLTSNARRKSMNDTKNNTRLSFAESPDRSMRILQLDDFDDDDEYQLTPESVNGSATQSAHVNNNTQSSPHAIGVDLQKMKDYIEMHNLIFSGLGELSHPPSEAGGNSHRDLESEK